MEWSDSVRICLCHNVLGMFWQIRKWKDLTIIIYCNSLSECQTILGMFGSSWVARLDHRTLKSWRGVRQWSVAHPLINRWVAIGGQQGPSMAISDHICPPINHRPNTFSLVEYKKQWRKSKRKPPTPVKQHFVLNVPRFPHQKFIECFIPESLEKQLKDILEVFLFLVFKESYQIFLLV